MNRIGRNQPCPCGSGRKYKNCHGRPTPGPASPGDTWRRLRRVLDGHPARMLHFVRDVYGVQVMQEAWEEFVLWSDDDLWFDAETPHMPLFMPWFFHAWRPEPGETSVHDPGLHDRPPTAVFLDRRGHRLDPLLRRYLEACLRSPFSFYEIVACEPGTGFRTRDVICGGEFHVLERSASRTFQVGDAFFGQVVTCDGVTLMESCGPCAIPPVDKVAVIELRERLGRSLNVPTPATLSDWDAELRELYLALTDRLLHPSIPVLRNTDGEDLVFHRLDFEIDSAQEAFDGLKDLAFDETPEDLLETADYDDEGHLRRVVFAWTAGADRGAPSRGSTVVAHVEIDGSRLVAEVNSGERAARFLRLVEDRLGPRARHLGTEVRTIDDLRNEARSGGGSAAPLAEDPAPADGPEVRRLIDEMTAAHYEDWVTEEIPVLGGLTPLDAVRTPGGRDKVEALITQIERDGREMDPPLDDAVVRRLRQRLGVSRAADPTLRVSFITVESGDDLTVGYAVELEDPDEVASLVLLRTPKYEFLLPPDERGVSVSWELDSDEGALLRRARVQGAQVELETTKARYRLDLARVDRGEAREAREVLERMHAHGGFELLVGD